MQTKARIKAGTCVAAPAFMIVHFADGMQAATVIAALPRFRLFIPNYWRKQQTNKTLALVAPETGNGAVVSLRWWSVIVVKKGKQQPNKYLQMIAADRAARCECSTHDRADWSARYLIVSAPPHAPAHCTVHVSPYTIVQPGSGQQHTQREDAGRRKQIQHTKAQQRRVAPPKARA